MRKILRQQLPSIFPRGIWQGVEITKLQYFQGKAVLSYAFTFKLLESSQEGYQSALALTPC